MALPLPKAVADMPEEGWIMSGLKHQNALTKQNIENKYLPLTSQADAASKLAYANLMGPQFLAKLMGNDAILANLPDEQKAAALQKLYGAGTGQGTGNAMMSGGAPNPNMMPSPRGDGALNALISYLMPQQQQQQAPQNSMMQPPQQQSQNAFAQPMPAPQQQGGGIDINNLPPAVQQKIQGMQPGESYRIPSATMPAPQGNPATWSENLGNYKGVVKEGEEAGRIRANAIDELDQQYQQAIQNEVPINHLMDMTQSPIFQKMRSDVPLFQDKQLQVLSKIGTPEEQKAVGDFITTTTNAVSNTLNGFKGRILDKEITMANQMKISPNDTWNVMLGKLGSISTFNEMTKQRARIASQIMKNSHASRGDALEQADKQVDGEKIRNNVDTRLNPKPTDADIEHMAEKYKISKDEVMKRLKAKGIL